MDRKYIRYVCACVYVLVHIMGTSSGESVVAPNSENSPQSSGDMIMKEDAEEMFYNIDLKKYDGVQCPEPEPPENGAIVGEGNQVGSVLYIECREGYKLDGSVVMACVPLTDGAQWDPTTPRICRPIWEKDTSQNTLTEKDIPTKNEQATEEHGHEKNRIVSPSTRKPWQHIQMYLHSDAKEEPHNLVPENNIVTSRCLDKPDNGPCRAALKRYYFSKATMECYTFMYGGCGGNQNNFLTLRECKEACLGQK